MICVEGHWETVDTFQDISRIIREYYNEELAVRLDKLVEYTEDEIQRMYYEIENLEYELDCL